MDAERLEPRSRGKAFEKVLGLMLEMEKIRHVLAYKPTGEEVDGAFWWNDHTFLLEAKWHKERLPASSIYTFKGKVDGKFSGTYGVFISMSGYADDCEDALVHGKALNILLFDGNDMKAIIGSNDTKGEKFTTVLTEKLFVAGQTGNVYIPWQDLQEVRKSIEALLLRPLFIICEGQTDVKILNSLLLYVNSHYHLQIENVRFISLNGKVISEILSVIKLLTTSLSGTAAILVVLDADAIDDTKAPNMRQYFLDVKKDIPENWEFHLEIATPYLEAWTDILVNKQINLPIAVWDVNWKLQAAKIQELENVLDFLIRVLPRQHTEAMQDIEQVRKEASRQYAEASQKIKQAREEASGENLLLKAEKFATSLMEKDELVNEAVALCPDFRQRELRQLGIEMSIAVIDNCDRIKRDHMNVAGSTRGVQYFVIKLEQDERTFFTDHAIRYLTETVLNADNSNAQGLLYLACMYGCRQQYDEMMEVLDRASWLSQVVQVMKDQFRKRPMMLFLVGACGSDQTKIERLRITLNLPPTTQSFFCEYAKEFPLASYQLPAPYIEWIAVRKPDAAGESGTFIIKITPPHPSKQEKVDAFLTPSDGRYQTPIVPEENRVSIEELYGILISSFFLFCPID